MEGLRGGGALNFAVAVEHELHSRVFLPFAKHFREKGGNAAVDDRTPRWLRDFCEFLQRDGRNPGLGTMFKAISEASRARTHLMRDFAEWLRQCHPTVLVDVPRMESDTRFMVEVRDRESHPRLVTKEEAERAARICRSILNVLVKPAAG